jgi:alkylhydroperoxidase family enzyme
VIIDVPEGKDPITYVWGEMVTGIGPAAATFATSVYSDSTLGLREFEAARLRVAQNNGCLFCQDWRTERDGQQVEDTFDTAVTEWRTTDALDERAGWPRSTPSGTASTTTGSTTSSGAG